MTDMFHLKSHRDHLKISAWCCSKHKGRPRVGNGYLGQYIAGMGFLQRWPWYRPLHGSHYYHSVLSMIPRTVLPAQ